MVDKESRLSELRCRMVSRPAPLRCRVYIPATLLRLQLTDFDLGSPEIASSRPSTKS